MEKIPSIPATESQEARSVEAEANFEGNETEVLISRLKNPIIKQQVIDTIYQQKVDRLNWFKNEEWVPHLPEGWTGEERFKLLKGKNSGEVISAEDLETELSPHIPTKEEIEKEVDEEMAQAETVTDIDFTANMPTSQVIPLDYKIPWTGKWEKATPKQMSITEAHEKGHRVRFYVGSTTEKFKRGFDISKVDFTQADYEMYMQDRQNQTDKGEDADKEISYEEFRDQYLNEYLFSGMEIAERMSQLKNYFGFKGDERFTKAHLDYAREHYIEDTNVDNGMRHFFQGITPETEDIFLELINNSGI